MAHAKTRSEYRAEEQRARNGHQQLSDKTAKDAEARFAPHCMLALVRYMSACYAMYDSLGRVLATLENMRALIRLEARILTGHRHDCHELRQPSGFRFRVQS